MVLNDFCCLEPEPVDIRRGFRVQSFVGGSIPQVLKCVEQGSEVKEAFIISESELQELVEAVLAFFSGKTEKKEGKSFKSIEGKPAPRAKLTDGSKHLSEFKFTEKRYLADYGQGADIIFKLVHSLGDRTCVSYDIEFALKGSSVDQL